MTSPSPQTPSGTHVIAGYGSVGTELATVLADAGADVVVMTRTAAPSTDPRIRRLALDITDSASLLAVCPSAVAIYNCVNPAYHQWPELWPPIARSLETYAERTSAVLVTCSNLYGYGPVDVPMTESMPLAATGEKGRVRAEVWTAAKALHDTGRIRATEVRGSDYITHGTQSRLGDRVIPRILAGKAVQLAGNVDQPHTWTAPRDVARLMAIAAADERAWGKPWHVPSNPARTQRQAVNDLATAAGVAAVKVSSVPKVLLSMLGLVNPMIRGLRETGYQTDRPYILDDTRTRATFGLEPTPWATILNDTIARYRTTTSR